MPHYCEVSLPVPLRKTFTYKCRADLAAPFSRVKVSLGRRQSIGMVLSVHQNKPTAYETKEIEAYLDDNPWVTPTYMKWLMWASEYYLTPLGEVLRSALPQSFFKDISYEKLTTKKSRLAPLKDHWTNDKIIELHQEQQAALDYLLSKTKHETILLHGITGSGKTEVYLAWIQELVRQQKQVIFLVPEIGLTPQVISRFKGLFGDKLGVYHSHLTENQRLIQWLRAKNGQSQVVVGTRSALFLPFENLGTIIIDEEHDTSYKQAERFRYHARDLAIVRGKMNNIPVLLGSATPSLETYAHAMSGKYHLLSLTQRALQAKIPEIRLIDMTAQKRQTHSPLTLCQELHTALQENLKKGEQSIILMNQRGFAKSFFCLDCEQSLLCPNCSVSLTYHRQKNELLCHYCDYTQLLPKTCPHCSGKQVTLLGFGTETIEEELLSFYPQARIRRLDRDSTQKKGELLKILKELKDHEIDILVGTQMIAKGHDIPKVTLVGILGLDVGLGLPDFRAAEKAFQLLMQVAGRAGRSTLEGRVIVQSFQPSHYSIQLAKQQDYVSFFHHEMANRQELLYPPAGKIILFQFSSSSKTKLMQFVRQLEDHVLPHFHADHYGSLQVLGPTPSPLEFLRGKLRWNMLFKHTDISALHKAARTLVTSLEKSVPTGVKWIVDVDPIVML